MQLLFPIVLVCLAALTMSLPAKEVVGYLVAEEPGTLFTTVNTDAAFKFCRGKLATVTIQPKAQLQQKAQPEWRTLPRRRGYFLPATELDNLDSVERCLLDFIIQLLNIEKKLIVLD